MLPQENHRKTIGKWWLNGIFMGLLGYYSDLMEFYIVILLGFDGDIDVIKHGVLENGQFMNDFPNKTSSHL